MHYASMGNRRPQEFMSRMHTEINKLYSFSSAQKPGDMSWRFISPLKITTQDTDGVDRAILSLSRQTTATLVHSRTAAPEQSSPSNTSHSSPKVHFISLGNKVTYIPNTRGKTGKHVWQNVYGLTRPRRKAHLC